MNHRGNCYPRGRVLSPDVANVEQIAQSESRAGPKQGGCNPERQEYLGLGQECGITLISGAQSRVPQRTV